MKKTFVGFIIFCFISTLLLNWPALATQEDTAQITFSKTATPRKNVHAYTVGQGEVLSAIIRKLPGITEKDIPRYYQMIKELNPGVRNLDRLYAGQTIILPGKSLSETETGTSVVPPGNNTLTSAGTPTMTYRIKKGDSLIHIVHHELRIKSRTQNALLLIKSLNPDMKNVNKIYAGQRIRLPESGASVKAIEDNANRVHPAAEQSLLSAATPTEDKSTSVLPSANEAPVQDVKSDEAKDSIVLPPAARLAVIKQIITEMNGSMITSGNYYLPVTRTEQVTIDCSVIPVLELDGSTMFLDLDNRSSQNLKKMISDHWSNYHLVKIDPKDDIIVILKKIFGSSKTYEITKTQKPLSVGTLPPLELMVDWVISKKGHSASSAKTQALRMVYENNPLFPKAAVNAARSSSIIVTEISPDKGLVAKPEEIYSLPPLTVFPKSSAREFCNAFTAYLKIDGEKDADVQVFNLQRDGFNLAIKADMVVTRGDKKTIIFCRTLPPQFVSILQKAGNELLFLSDQDEPVRNMEKILRAFQFVSTTGYFTFDGTDKNQPPYTFGFNGTKIKLDKDVYVVNFDFNQDLRGLLQETWSAVVVRY